MTLAVLNLSTHNTLFYVPLSAIENVSQITKMQMYHYQSCFRDNVLQKIKEVVTGVRLSEAAISRPNAKELLFNLPPNSQLKKNPRFKRPSQLLSTIMTYQVISLSILIRHSFLTCPLESTHVKGSKKVPIRGVDGKTQITAALVVTETGGFQPI